MMAYRVQVVSSAMGTPGILLTSISPVGRPVGHSHPHGDAPECATPPRAVSAAIFFSGDHQSSFHRHDRPSRSPPLLVDNQFSNSRRHCRPWRSRWPSVCACDLGCRILPGLHALTTAQRLGNRSTSCVTWRSMTASPACPTRTRPSTDRLDHEIDLADDTGGKVVLIGIDLNRFKDVKRPARPWLSETACCRSWAHAWRICWSRTNSWREPAATSSRLSSDTPTRRGSRISWRGLEGALSETIRTPDFEIAPGASFGVAFYPDNAPTREVLLINNADLAMYRRGGRSRPSCLLITTSPWMYIVRARRGLATDLRVDHREQ